MGLFSNKKKLCPVCGEPTPRLFPTKVDDTALCKECAKKIYLPDGKLEQMTIDEFLQYMSFYEENQSLRERFTKTFDSKNAGIVLDETNRLFRLRDESAALVFEVSNLKSFRILEDNTVLFEGCVDPVTGRYHIGTVYTQNGKAFFSGEIGEGFDWNLIYVE